MDNQKKTNIITTGFVLVCLILYFTFPFGGLKFENWLGMICVLLVLPVLYSKIILKQSKDVIGFNKMAINRKTWFFLGSSVVIGGILSFFLVSLGFGISKYIDSLSLTIVSHFGAFMFYELFFSAISIFLFTFFSFGFVYSIKYKNEVYSKLFTIFTFVILVADFYVSWLLWIPLVAPAFFIKQIREGKNIVFMFLAIFIIALMIDTLVIKSIS